MKNHENPWILCSIFPAPKLLPISKQILTEKLKNPEVIEDFTALDPFGMVTRAPRYLKALPLLGPPVGKDRKPPAGKESRGFS